MLPPVRRRVRWLPALALSGLLAAGCQSQTGPGVPAPSPSSTAAAPSGDPAGVGGPDAASGPSGVDVTLTTRLPRRAATSVSALADVEPAARVDLPTIRDAPRLVAGERFTPEAAFALNIFAPDQVLPYDRLWLASRAGEVRSLDLRALGVSDPGRGERAFALSPDRRALAVADTGRILAVDLRTGAVRSRPVDAEQPVALTWVPDADAVWFIDRTTRAVPTTSRLDLATGAVDTTSFDLIGSSSWPEADGLARLGPDRGAGTTDVVVQAGDERAAVVGTLPIVIQPQGYPSCAALCAIVERRTRVAGAPVAPGVATFDPRTGRFGPILGVVTSGEETLDLAGWAGRTTLEMGLAADGVTRLLRWDVVTGELRAVLELGVQGLVLSTARG